MQKTSSNKTVAYAIFASLTLAGLRTAVLSSFNGTTSVFAQGQTLTTLSRLIFIKEKQG